MWNEESYQPFVIPTTPTPKATTSVAPERPHSPSQSTLLASKLSGSPPIARAATYKGRPNHPSLSSSDGKSTTATTKVFGEPLVKVTPDASDIPLRHTTQQQPQQEEKQQHPHEEKEENQNDQQRQQQQQQQPIQVIEAIEFDGVGQHDRTTSFSIEDSSIQPERLMTKLEELMHQQQLQQAQQAQQQQQTQHSFLHPQPFPYQQQPQPQQPQQPQHLAIQLPTPSALPPSNVDIDLSSATTFLCKYNGKLLGDCSPSGNILVAIATNGVHFLRPFTMEKVTHQPYANIASWSYNPREFEIEWGGRNMKTPIKFTFETSQGKEMIFLLNRITQDLAEKSKGFLV